MICKRVFAPFLKVIESDALFDSTGKRASEGNLLLLQLAKT
jgi:hypothetical protein